MAHPEPLLCRAIDGVESGSLTGSRRRAAPSQDRQGASPQSTNNFPGLGQADGIDLHRLASEIVTCISSVHQDFTESNVSQYIQDVTSSLRILHLLLQHGGYDSPEELDVLTAPRVSYAVALHDTVDDPWASERNRELSQHILSLTRLRISTVRQDGGGDLFFGHDVLKDIVQPIFTNSASRSGVDPRSGRKAAELVHTHLAPATSDDGWRHTGWGVWNAMGHLLDQGGDESIARDWNLFVPPIILLMEDTSAFVRTRGARLASKLVGRCPSSLLVNSGIDRVFRKILAVNYSILDQPDSPPLLHATFQAHMQLVKKAASQRPKQAPSDSMQAIDYGYHELMQAAILRVCGHLSIAADPLATIAFAISGLEQLCEALGVGAVRYVQFVVPFLTRAIDALPPRPENTTSLVSAMSILQWLLNVCHLRLRAWEALIIVTACRLLRLVEERPEMVDSDIHAHVRSLLESTRDVGGAQRRL